MKFEPEHGDTDLAETTGADVRYVALVWRNDDDGNGRPELMLGGMSEFEAEAVMRAAVRRLAAYNEQTIDVPADIDLEAEDDEDAD